ncbi:hypothetical protein HU200_056458 [Digitaria exilis]|uniref:Late embryogenesis abundant protein LEA-2 subgroup domain-containing protein n=1 Tax=Digitaria exilis TaxID=1010633 RepID=A0A835ACR1_9POAL|nr:hypothetical protein HU200_056458 [Digitaria exilis]
MATLAVAVIVTIVFIVLCPARVTFSVVRTSFHHEDSTTTTGSLRLNLTLAIDNHSRRAAAAYKSMFVDLSNTTARFKVGVAWTRLYDIKVSCAPVAFFLADDEAKLGGAASLPVKCV